MAAISTRTYYFVKYTILFATLALLVTPVAQSFAGESVWRQELNAYNIAWTNRSNSSSNSMPLSGGNLGLNVWVEKDDVCFLIGSPNCMDEKGMQVKLGLVRIRLSPAAFDHDFKQELCLAQSEIVITGKTAAGATVKVILWCGIKEPVVHVETTSGEPVEVTATYETWSNYETKTEGNSLQWSRRLADVNVRRLNDIKAQGMSEFSDKVSDPLSGLSAGGRITAPGMVAADSGTATFNGIKTRTCAIKTAAPVKQLNISIALRMEQDKSLAEWETQLNKEAIRAEQNADADRAAALAWWNEFWDRSHICINPGTTKLRSGNSNSKSPAATAWEAGRNYQLFRYMLAANLTGRAMTLFNGGNFTCSGNPDKRMWDNCQFMGQNQMLVYWPMMRAGDFDMLKVGCDFYRDRTEMRRFHARKFWDIDGVTFPEPLSIFGLDALGTTADGRTDRKHLNYHYTSGMVFALMMLGHDSYSGTTSGGYADAALGIISYYDNYYQKKLLKETGKPLDANGKLIIYPSDACEPYHGCVNNIDVLAGLMALSRDLLDTPPGGITATKRAYATEFVKRIPAFKTEEKNGRKLYAAADKAPEWIFENTNMDFPQMYICFPFSAVSLGRSDMELVKNTWELGPVNATVQHQNQCWYQNAINFARMGETDRASEFTLEKLNHPGLRFPAFYYTKYLKGGSFCHPPDADHGGVAMTALQEMIMQTDGKRILLGPAWPAEWDCHFKLHAPYQTTVEGRVANGKLVVEKVTPESRRKDLEIFPLKRSPKPPVSTGKPATATYNPGDEDGTLRLTVSASARTQNDDVVKLILAN